MCGVTLNDSKSSEKLRVKMALDLSILDLLRNRRLQWLIFGLVQRGRLKGEEMPDDRGGWNERPR